MTEMAISNYLGIFIVLLLSYPFVLVVVNIAILAKMLEPNILDG